MIRFIASPRSSDPIPTPALSVLQDTISTRPPETVKGFVLGIVQALKFVHADPDGAAAIAKRSPRPCQQRT